MEHWVRTISNPSLKKAYDSYLQKQEKTLTFYLASVAVSKHAEFPEQFHDMPVRASTNFEEIVTSIRSVGQISALVKDGRYDQLSRSINIISLVTSFGEFFDEIKKQLNLNTQDLKKPIELISDSKPLLLVRPIALKIAHRVNVEYDLNARICDDYSLRWINCIINLRHIFMHECGNYTAKYSQDMFATWADLNEGEAIIFGENQFDSILWFLNDHVRDFVERLDKKL